MEALTTEKETLTEQVAALASTEADAEALRQANEDLTASGETMTAEIAALQAEVEALQAEVETLQAELETLRADSPETPAELVASIKGFSSGELTVHVVLEEGVIASLTVETPNETPGFGTQCSEEAFTGQFIGKALPLTLGEDVDAVSGATVTSQAVVDALNSLTEAVE